MEDPQHFRGLYKFRLPGATGLCLSNPPGLAQSGTAGQYQHEVANPKARVSPRAPLKARVTNALLRACSPGTPEVLLGASLSFPQLSWTDLDAVLETQEDIIYF